MATFSTNQVRHFYVANSLKTPHVLSTDSAGSIAVKSDTDKNHLYFEYKGADNLMRSDLIDIKNILSIKATNGKDMALKIKQVSVTLDSDVNEGEPVSGQDYILRIAFRQFLGMSDEDQYFKFGMVHAYSGMSASDFYKTLAISLAKNFSREGTQLLKFKLFSSATDQTEVTATTKDSSLTGTYSKLIIEEVPQPWKRGVMEQVPVYFTVQPTTIEVDGDERVWGEIEETLQSSTVNNGHKIADLEYFCMGERGDMYRSVGFPHNIETKYLVDPDTEYSVIDIHYAYVGSNESVQKSEKTITIACPSVAIANSIVSAINTATGLSIATLPTS